MEKLKKGDRAPEFEALNDQNETVSLKELRGQKVILYFYPKDDTPGCTTQACLFRDRHAEIQEVGGVVFGVSPDGVESHQKFKETYQLPFALLADPEHELAKKFGVWGEKSRYGKKSHGIIRSHFVIDESGTILDAQYKISPTESVPMALGAFS